MSQAAPIVRARTAYFVFERTTGFTKRFDSRIAADQWCAVLNESGNLDASVIIITDLETDVHRQELAEDKHKGIRIAALQRLRRIMPVEYSEREDLLQDIHVMALEAAERFDSAHESGCTFPAYLTRCLRDEGRNLQQRQWIRSSGNENCRMVPICRRDNVRQIDVDRNESDSIAIDGGRIHIDEFSTPSEAESVAVLNELAEHVERLCPSMGEFVRKLRAHPDRDAVCRALVSGHLADKLRELGFDHNEARQFLQFRERRLKRLATQYAA